VFERRFAGELPPKHHLASRDADGRLRYEECLTRAGFDGPYSILYRIERPHLMRPLGTTSKPLIASQAASHSLRRRHFRSQDLPSAGTASNSRVALLFNDDLVLSVSKPVASDDGYFVNAEGDELLFILDGRGIIRSPFGDLHYAQGDYVMLPKGVLHRVVVDSGSAHWLSIESRSGIGIPGRFRNPVGQLRMDAPYCHRDFRVPEFKGPQDEHIREVTVRRDHAEHRFEIPHSPLDAVGWDGAVYPWAFHISNFQPRVSSVHLPPTWHGTFESPAALICSFVPRPLDFHPQAVACPYPHSSVDIDEVIFYVAGSFSSRRGVDSGSLSLHPAGIPHGPHPGRYEASIGAKYTEELAVMLDCTARLNTTSEASTIEDAAYEDSFHAQ